MIFANGEACRICNRCCLSGLPFNPHVKKWLAECVELCQPSGLRVLDGSDEERRDLLAQAVAEGVLIQLNQDKLPGCYLHRSHLNDVARTEQNTYICTPNETLAGPTNNWLDSRQAYPELRELFTAAMRGRTMYVIPFVMGPLGSPLARVGVQLTDSLYVALSMGLMTRMGKVAWDQLGDRRRIHALPALRGPVRSGQALHLPFHPGQHRLELWLRLRRQRSAGQKVPGPAHRQLPGLPRSTGWRSTCC